nr:MAG TPA: hypothetical protein [Caudoviricetes sp.]
MHISRQNMKKDSRVNDCPFSCVYAPQLYAKNRHGSHPLF